MNHDLKVGEHPITVAVPADVHRALVRNKLKLSDYLNFDKVKAALSSEDIKHWYSIIEALKIGGKKLSDSLMYASFSKNEAAAINGFKPVHFDPYFYPSNTDIEQANLYLNQSNAMTENFYSLYRDGCVVFVIVEEGFSVKLEENTNKLEFLKMYFRKLSEIMPVHALAKNPLHLQYVTLVTT